MVKLLADLGTACDAYHDEHVQNVAAKRIECDEIWSFCYGKDKNIPDEKKAEGAGSLWTWTALNADSKLIVSSLCGGRDASWGKAFMEDVASRLTSRVQITTDGRRVYPGGRRRVWYGCGLRYAYQAVRGACDSGHPV